VGRVVRGYVPDFPGGGYEIPLASLAGAGATAEDVVVAVTHRAPGAAPLALD
jgi:hypothetical protein